MNNIPAHILEELETLRATIRGCDEALASELEAWERKEYAQAREETAAILSARESSVAVFMTR